MATVTAIAKDARTRGAARATISQMTTYDWVALDKRGKRMKGEMPAKNASLVKAELRRQGMNPQTVRERSKPLFGASGSTVKPRDIAIFSRQIATMMASGVPMVQSFEIIADGQKNVRFKNILVDVKQGIEGGSALHEALAKYPVQFDELYRNLVHAGESSGVLDTVLDTVATYKERMEGIKSKIKKALFYPVMVLVVALLVSMILLLFVVPVFEQTFKDAGAELPAQKALGQGCALPRSTHAAATHHWQHPPPIRYRPFRPHSRRHLPSWRSTGRSSGSGSRSHRQHRV